MTKCFALALVLFSVCGSMCDNDLPSVGSLTTLRPTERLARQLGTLTDLKIGICEVIWVYNFLTILILTRFIVVSGQRSQVSCSRRPTPWLRWAAAGAQTGRWTLAQCSLVLPFQLSPYLKEPKIHLLPPLFACSQAQLITISYHNHHSRRAAYLLGDITRCGSRFRDDEISLRVHLTRDKNISITCNAPLQGGMLPVQWRARRGANVYASWEPNLSSPAWAGGAYKMGWCDAARKTGWLRPSRRNRYEVQEKWRQWEGGKMVQLGAQVYCNAPNHTSAPLFTHSLTATLTALNCT